MLIKITNAFNKKKVNVTNVYYIYDRHRRRVMAIPALAVSRGGRLKMRDMKIRDGQKCRGGKCET